jgi:dolichyl-phosphate-mannose-protein mannosyltransferase
MLGVSGRHVRKLLFLFIFGAGSFLHAWLTFTDTSTEDEHVHIYTGALLLDYGRTTINLEHPPLGKVLGAGLLSLTSPARPDVVELWNAQQLGYAVAKFAYGNRVPIRSMLTATRIPFLLLTIGLGLVVWSFASRWGTWAAALAASLTMFSPLLLAVGHLVHTDLLVTFFVVAGWLAGIRWIESEKPGWAIVAGTLFGLALLSKFSAAVFVLGFAITGLILGRRKLRVLLLLAVAGCVLWIGMAVSYRAVDAEYVAQLVGTTGRTNVLLETPGLRPLGMYLLGVETFLSRGGMAVNYFAGNFSSHGWWFYFPIAFILKTPFGVLLLIVLALATRVRRLDRLDVLLLVPVVSYVAVSLFSQYNIGVRHLLPIYPFLHLFVARALGSDEAPATLTAYRSPLRLAVAALVLLALGEVLITFPHPMGFFNVIAGSRDTAVWVLSDSNVDWGQDNGRLGEFLRDTRVPSAQVLLMGGSLPEYEVGARVRRIVPYDEPVPGTYAVSRALFTELTQFASLPINDPVRQKLSSQPRFGDPYGLYLLRMSQRGKRTDRIGNSIDIYRVP